MKKKLYALSIVIFFMGLTSNKIFAQQHDETLIRDLENLQREAVLKGDTALLYDLWSPNIVVNTPANRVMMLDSLKYFVRTGRLDYGVLDRMIEKVTFNKNIAIVMGREVLKPQGASANTGKTVYRRYTNIWMPGGKNGWQIVARQSTIINVE